ncbi:MAG TPA: hypothetical protein VKM37_01215 [Balneolaceae bacterium]|nr:hypothetical protein [Balneolaceae bacterium]
MPEIKQFHPQFPLSDVDIKQVRVVKELNEPALSSDWLQMTENEFRMIATDAGTFYAANGKSICFSPDAAATDESIELYMNGSVFGAILHQRGILPIHGSSLVYKERGIMLCGHSGAGKSSLTSAMCLSGQATFLTDDVTPILFYDEKPLVMPKSDRVKLWEDSLEQLSEKKEELKRIRPLDEKYYLQLDKPTTDPHPLHQVVILSVDEKINAPKIEDMTGAQAFSVLQKEIYRLFYLQAMPHRKAHYFTQLSTICNHCHILRLIRPPAISIQEMSEFLTGTVLSGR